MLGRRELQLPKCTFGFLMAFDASLKLFLCLVHLMGLFLSVWLHIESNISSNWRYLHMDCVSETTNSCFILFWGIYLRWMYVRIYFGYLLMKEIAGSYGVLIQKLPKMVIPVCIPSRMWYPSRTTSLSTFRLVRLFHFSHSDEH